MTVVLGPPHVVNALHDELALAVAESSLLPHRVARLNHQVDPLLAHQEDVGGYERGGGGVRERPDPAQPKDNIYWTPMTEPK